MADVVEPVTPEPVSPEPVSPEPVSPEPESVEQVTTLASKKKLGLPIAALVAVALIGAVGGYVVTHSSVANNQAVGFDDHFTGGQGGPGMPGGSGKQGRPGMGNGDGKGMGMNDGDMRVRCQYSTKIDVRPDASGNCPTGAKKVDREAKGFVCISDTAQMPVAPQADGTCATGSTKKPMMDHRGGPDDQPSQQPVTN